MSITTTPSVPRSIAPRPTPAASAPLGTPAQPAKRGPGRPPIWNEDNVAAVMDGYVARLGRVPYKGELEAGGHAGVATWLARNVGRQAAIATWLGARREIRYEYAFDTPAAIAAAVAPLVRELGRMPTKRELDERGLSGVSRALRRYGAGFGDLAAAFGLAANLPHDPRRHGSQSCVCGATHRRLVSMSCYAIRCGRIDPTSLRDLLERRATGAIDDAEWDVLRGQMGDPALAGR